MKINNNLIELIHKTFPERTIVFNSLDDLGRSIRHEDSDEVFMMSRFLNISWREVSPKSLRTHYEAYCLFSNIAYAVFIPSVLLGALTNYNDSNFALFCIVRDIVDYNERRRLVFDEILTTDQLKVVGKVFEDQGVCQQFEMHWDTSEECDSSLLRRATGRIECIIAERKKNECQTVQ